MTTNRFTEVQNTIGQYQPATSLSDWIYETVRPYLKGRILEIASRVGNITELLIRDGYQLKISDPRARYCRILQEKFGNHPNIMGIYQIDPFLSNFTNTHERFVDKCNTVLMINHIEDNVYNDSIYDVKQFVTTRGHLVLRIPIKLAIYDRSNIQELEYWRLNNLHAIRKHLGKDFKIWEPIYFNVSKSQADNPHPAIPSFQITDENFSDPMGVSALIIGKRVEP